MGPRRCVADQLLAKVDVIRGMRERVQPCQDPETEFAFLRESLAESITSSGCMATPFSLRKRRPNILTKLDRGSLEVLFPGFTEDGAQQAGIACQRSVHVAHLAASPDCGQTLRSAIAGLLPEQPRVVRLDNLVEASTAFLDTFDVSEKHAAHLHLRKQSRQQKKRAAANRTRPQWSIDRDPNDRRNKTR